MRTDPVLRKRVASQPVILADLSAAHDGTGVLPPPTPQYGPANQVSGMARIIQGLFGAAQPVSSSQSFQVAVGPGLYNFHEGDLFTPGTQNYVFDYPFELPLQTIWGHAFLRQPNTFSVYQPPQVMSQPNVFTNGIGGLIAGQMAFQPLESTPDS